MFFDKILASTILLAFVSAQVDKDTVKSGPVDPATQDDEYPLMSQYFAEGATYEDYTWEAHKVVTADEYVKTLFHLTGRKSQETPSNGKTVLVVNGAGSNAMSYFGQDYSNPVADSRAATRELYHDALKQAIEADD
jgi:hypothetical protein